MADEGEALLEALKVQRNRAMDTSAIMEARWAKARADNAKLSARVAELEAENKALRTTPTPADPVEKNVGSTRKRRVK